jgi:hypothetical protein
MLEWVHFAPHNLPFKKGNWLWNTMYIVGILISLWLSKGMSFLKDSAAPHKAAIKHQKLADHFKILKHLAYSLDLTHSNLFIKPKTYQPPSYMCTYTVIKKGKGYIQYYGAKFFYKGFVSCIFMGPGDLRARSGHLIRRFWVWSLFRSAPRSKPSP